MTTTGTATASGALTAAGLDLLGVGGAYTLDQRQQCNDDARRHIPAGDLFADNAGFAIGTVKAPSA